jgi:iron(III) transport system ATP-binding protein
MTLKKNNQADIPAVEFRAVRKAFGDFVAIEDLNFAIRRGTLVTFLGPSGCGKTTTLRLIAGLERASGGTILIDGVDITGRPVAERDVSMVFQSYALFPHMSVLSNVAYGLVSSGRPRREAEGLAREALALVGLDGLAERLPSELSGGQQQRVAVARAIVLRPSVLLFDEPLSNLDAKLRRRVRDEIRDLQQRLNLTVVYVTHDQAEALAVSDRVIVMNNARIAQDATPVELYRSPASRFVASFVGEANIVAAGLQRRDSLRAAVSIGSLVLDLPHRGVEDGDVEVAIRPEAVVLATGAGAGGLPGLIKRATFLGDRLEYHIETEIGLLFAANSDFEKTAAPGDAVHVVFKSDGVAVLPKGAAA